MRVLVAALLGASALAKIEQKIRTHTDEEYWAGWQTFLQLPEVQERTLGYLEKAEHDFRFEIFKDNMEEIKAHNAAGHKWTKGITQFADMTGAEFKDHISCFMGEKKPAPGGVFTGEGVEKPLDDVDWTTKGAVTPVKNQGSCGSCWAFSTTGSIEGRCEIKNGNLQSLAEQDLVDCDGTDSGCNGGLMDNAFGFVHKNGGLCAEDDYEYVAKAHFRCKENGCTKYGKISSYTDVTPKSTSAMEAAISQGPVSIAIEADQQAFQLYTGGVLDSSGCGSRLDHGVLAVGYGTLSGDDYWKVKNSWGASWGKDGYILLCRNCDKNDGKGQCGLLAQPSFPICD